MKTLLCVLFLSIAGFAQTPTLDTALNSGAACTPGSNPEECPGTCVNGNEAATANLSTPSCAIPAGDYAVITATAVRPASTLSLVDTVGDTIENASSFCTGTTYPFHDTVQDGDVYVFFIRSAKGGANVFTSTPTSGNSALEIHVSAWKNMSGWLPDQCSTANAATGGTSFNSGSRTTLFDGELIFGYTFPFGNSLPGSGFSGLSFVNGDWDEQKIQTTHGSVSATFTSDSSSTWLATMVTFAAPQTPAQPAAPAAAMFANLNSLEVVK